MATFPGNPAASALTGAEIVPVTQGGVDSRTTTQDIADLASGVQSYTIVTEASTSTATVGTNDGLSRYNRAADDITFDSGESYTAGMVFNYRATSDLSLIESGVTLTPPAGGSHDLESGMAVQVVMTGATSGDIIGQTVGSS